MKKYLKYPLALISPVLAYLTYTGSVGALNLLTAWTAFGLFMTVILISLVAFVFIAAAFLPDDKKINEVLDGMRVQTKNMRRYTFHTWMDISCIVFFVWCGWWGLAFMEFAQFFLVKFTAYFAPQKIDEQ